MVPFESQLVLKVACTKPEIYGDPCEENEVLVVKIKGFSSFCKLFKKKYLLLNLGRLGKVLTLAHM